MRVRLLAPAKINLYLKVLARREDGYHDIESLVLPVSLCDLVYVERTGSGIEVRCDHPGCPDGEGNLAYRAAGWFFDVSGISGCVRIDIRKRIPVGAGLGGGSSDAAAVIKAMELLFDFELEPELKRRAAFDIGADVPSFFVQGAKLVRGIGDIVEPVEYRGPRWFALVNPPIEVSTASVYETFSLSLTRQKSENKMKAQGAFGKNDLEEVVIGLHPEVGEAMEEMREHGFVPCISGSGPTYFVPLDSPEQASGILRAARQRNYRVYVVHNI